MARRNITMHMIKQLLLMRSQGNSIKHCARELNLARNTVRKYCSLCEGLNRPLDELLALSEPELLDLLEEDVSLEPLGKRQFDVLVPEILRSLEQPGVTRRLLWEEYVASGQLSMEYSWFCELLKAHRKHAKTTMVMRHEPGQKAFLDFAGKKLKYTDRQLNKEVACEVLVLTFGYSNMTFARALPSQKLDDVLSGLSALLEEAGGCPQVLVPDNMKTAVVKPDRYEPKVQPMFLACCTHYGMVVLPARVGKPQDKSKVERHVRFIYEQAYSRMRDDSYYGIEELNRALRAHLDRAMDRLMGDYKKSRRELFAHERPLLRPLPSVPYEHLHIHHLKLESNCHVRIRALNSYFSAPYGLIGERLTVVRSPEQITIYHQNKSVATHAYLQGKLYHTEERHLPSQYREYAGRLDKEHILRRAYGISQEVGHFVEQLLKSKRHPEQAYKSCEGVLRLTLQVSVDRLSRSCRHAAEQGRYSYTFVRGLATNPRALLTDEPPVERPLPQHENIRGSMHFQ